MPCPGPGCRFITSVLVTSGNFRGLITLKQSPLSYLNKLEKTEGLISDLPMTVDKRRTCSSIYVIVQ
jgi:hypothetical protein